MGICRNNGIQRLYTKNDKNDITKETSLDGFVSFCRKGITMNQETLLISEAAKQVHVETHVLRYWEEELQLPIKRNEMGHRYYTLEDVNQFREIKLLKEQGLQLKAIRSILKKDYMNANAGTGANAGINMNADKNADTGMYADECANTGTNTNVIAAAALNESSSCINMHENTEQNSSSNISGDTEQNVGSNAPAYTDKGTDMDAIASSAEEKAMEYMIGKRQKFIVSLSNDNSKEEKSKRLQYLLQHMITECVKNANKELGDEIKESVLKELDYQFRARDEKEEEHWKKEEEHYRKVDEMLRKHHRIKEKPIKKERKRKNKGNWGGGQD